MRRPSDATPWPPHVVGVVPPSARVAPSPLRQVTVRPAVWHGGPAEEGGRRWLRPVSYAARVRAPAAVVWAVVADPAWITRWEPAAVATVERLDHHAWQVTQTIPPAPRRARTGRPSVTRTRVHLLRVDAPRSGEWEFVAAERAPEDGSQRFGVRLSDDAGGTRVELTMRWTRGRGRDRAVQVLVTPLTRGAVRRLLARRVEELARAVRPVPPAT